MFRVGNTLLLLQRRNAEQVLKPNNTFLRVRSGVLIVILTNKIPSSPITIRYYYR
jgi:hypothetical protein